MPRSPKFPKGKDLYLPALLRLAVRSILLPQNEQFYVTDSMWVNLGNVRPDQSLICGWQKGGLEGSSCCSFMGSIIRQPCHYSQDWGDAK